MENFIEQVTGALKNKKVWGVGLALALLIVAVGVWFFWDGAGLTQIDLTARYAAGGGAHTVAVEQEIAYLNRTGSALDEICLHLYPLAYATEETAPIPEGEMAAAYPNGFAAGGAVIGEILVGGKAASFRTEGTVIRVALEKPLKEGDTARLRLAYTLDVPDSRIRFGAGEETVNLLNAFAIPAVYGDDGWRTDAYSAVGDPFLSEVMRYKAQITAPEHLSVASTGTVKSTKTKDGETTWTIEAPGARDFAAVLGEFKTARAKVGKVEIVSNALTMESAEAALAYAADAAASMAATFGPSAYTEIEVCSADLYTGGMEYPGLAVIATELYAGENGPALEYCVVHEVAHQWWYGAVGSDQVREPWLDESLAEYSTLVYFEQNHGAQGFQEAYRRFIRPHLVRAGLASIPIEQPITAFDDAMEYSAVVYAKGAAMWHALRQDMGDEAFFGALSNYYNDNVQRVATKQDLYAALGGNWAAVVEDWLTGRAP